MDGLHTPNQLAFGDMLPIVGRHTLEVGANFVRVEAGGRRLEQALVQPLLRPVEELAASAGKACATLGFVICFNSGLHWLPSYCDRLWKIHECANAWAMPIEKKGVENCYKGL